MGEARESRTWPGLGVVTLVAGALVVFGFWTAMHRTARVDDALANDPAAAAKRWPDMRVNINSAEVAELALLPGVGPRLAQRIVENREAHGRFAAVDDLNRVQGMGAGTVDRLRAYATVGPQSP